MKQSLMQKIVERIPHWFTAPLMLKKDGGCCEGCDEVVHKWFAGYKVQKAEKIWTKNELLLIAWHPWRHEDGWLVFFRGWQTGDKKSCGKTLLNFLLSVW